MIDRFLYQIYKNLISSQADPAVNYLTVRFSLKNNPWRFQKPVRYGAPIPTGEITLEDLYNIVPMGPVISTVELSGAEIFEIIEKNLEHTYSNDPLRQMGGYVRHL